MIVQIWTDGSAWPNPGPGGWAFVMRYGEPEVELTKSGHLKQTTNQRAEMTAAIWALWSVPLGATSVTLTTDSEYVKRALSERGIMKVRANADLYEKARLMVVKHHPTVLWVRGHIGHPENERCDQLALAARLQLHKEKVP